jgi:hypothetical protein
LPRLDDADNIDRQFKGLSVRANRIVMDNPAPP